MLFRMYVAFRVPFLYIFKINFSLLKFAHTSSQCYSVNLGNVIGNNYKAWTPRINKTKISKDSFMWPLIVTKPVARVPLFRSHVPHFG